MMESPLEAIQDIVRNLASIALSAKKETSESQSNHDLKTENIRLRKALKEIRQVVNGTLQDGDRGIDVRRESTKRELKPNTEAQAMSDQDPPIHQNPLDQIKQQLQELFLGPGIKVGDLDDSDDEIDVQALLQQTLYERPHLHEDNEEVMKWRETAEKETEKVENLKCMPGRAVILCLDTSESMNEGSAWEQAKRFFQKYLDGIQALWEQGSSYDFMALVTFGGDVCVKVNPTQDLEELKNTFENLTLGGPTQMFGGLVVARSIACKPEAKVCVNDYLLQPQIILITDGKPTELGRKDGSDVPDEENMETTRTIILDELQFFRNLDFHCVLVGDCGDKFFLTNVLEKGRNKPRKRLMTYNDGSKMAWFSTNEIAKHGNRKYVNPEAGDKELKTISMFGNEVLSMYKECSTGKFREYPIGTRVRRGYDWSFGNQDSHGVGTIIGHDEERSYAEYVRVWVEWDSGHRNNYVVKSLSITNEDRVPPGKKQIAVGSAVKPGKDFREDKTSETGVVINMKTDTGKATVRWDSGKRGSYHYGNLGTPQEVEPVRIPEPDLNFVDDKLSEQDLVMIAAKIGKNWRILGVQLGLKNVTLDHLEAEQKTEVQRIAAMLNRWKDMKGEEATLQNLLTILRRNADVVNIAWDEIEIIRKKMRTTSAC